MKECEQNKKYCCDYRGWTHYLIVCIGVACFGFTSFAAIKFDDYIIGGIAAIVFIYTGYFVLEMMNKRVFLEENMIVVRNIWRRKKRYKISDVSNLVISNNMNSTYVLVKVAEKKIKIRKSPNGYYEFVEELCRRLKLTGYSKGGKKVIDIKK